MATIGTAREKWERKMADAGAKWKAGVTGKADAYAKGMAAFGAPVGPITQGNFAKGVDAITAETFQAAVRGKGAKWARRLKEAVAK